jgi:hypothetical protein
VTDSTYLEPLLGVIRDLVAWMKDQNIPGAVIGGVAAGLLGRPRVTRDVDAVLLLDISDAESFLAAGSRFGFSPRFPDAVAFAARRRVLLAVHDATGLTVDLSLGATPFEKESISRATVRTVAGVSFPVITAEDLVVMKALARRTRDVADIEAVLDAHPDLDLERVRYWVGEFATLLETPEILDELEGILLR